MLRVWALVCMGLTLVACAPVVQSAARPPMGFQGARIEAERFVSFDGARLGLSTWEAQGGEPWAVIVGLHGMNDYGQAFRVAAPYWAQHGVTTYAYDQRGFGRSPKRGIWAGEDLMVHDLRTMVGIARQRHPEAVIAVVGESMGSAVAIAAFASSSPPDADRLVLMAPAVWGWSRQPLPQKAPAWIAGRTLRGKSIEPPRIVTRRIMASDNIDYLREMGRDPNMLFSTRFDAISGIIDLMETAWARTGRIRVPTAYLYGRQDQIIPEKPSFEAAARLKPTDQTAFYDEGYHLLMVDRQAENVWRDVESFIRDPGARLPSGAPPIPSHAQASRKVAQNVGSSRTLTAAPTSGASSRATRH